MPGDLGFDALSPELLGDAVEAFGKYAEPPAQQNHMSTGGETTVAPQKDHCQHGSKQPRANPFRQTATPSVCVDRPMFSFARVFRADSRR